MEKILAFVDLLGFSNMVNQNEGRARDILNDFYNISFREIKRVPSVKGHLFSDSLLAYSTSKEDLINCLAKIYQKCLLKNRDYDDRSRFFLLPRGAMSIGVVNTEERNTAPNLTKDFITSTALVHSAKLEAKIKGSRLLVAVKNEDPQNLQINWNPGIKYGLYEDEGFVFLDNYKYKDILWYSPHTDGQNERNALINLIDIAASLVLDNQINDNTLIQHIWTLRIGLLNYSKYLGRENDPILMRIINDFHEDRYWLVWMTMIEMIVGGSSEWKYAANANIVSFFKRNILRPGWAKLIEEINKPGQIYALNCFQRFTEEIQFTAI